MVEVITESYKLICVNESDFYAVYKDLREETRGMISPLYLYRREGKGKKGKT